MTKIRNSHALTSATETPTPSNHSEQSSYLVASHKLNGHNYLQWSQYVLIFICGKSKYDYLRSVEKAQENKDPTFKVWKADNNMVMSWLVNSMAPEIGENFLLYSTAAEIWEAARVTFSSTDNTSELFETESILHDLRQSESSVTQYFSTLTQLWQKIDLYKYKWTCPVDAALYNKIVETKRVFKLLSGLNKEPDVAITEN